MNKELLSTLIKNKRKESKLTQQEFADKIGVSLMSVVRWENGSRVPNMLLMPKIAEELNTTVGYLMGIEDSPDPVQTPEPATHAEQPSSVFKNTGYSLVYERNGERMELPPTAESYAIFRDIAARIANREVSPAMA